MKNGFSTPAFLWPLLALICVLFILAGLNKAVNKTNWTASKKSRFFYTVAVAIVLWIALLAVLSTRGFFSDFSRFPPRPALAVMSPLPFVIWFIFSKSGCDILQVVPPHWLVFFQSFRILVEVLLWFAFLANKLPVQMTFEGRNFDVVTGVLALPAGYFVYKKKEYTASVILVFNTIGILLLLNILVIAVLSMPTPLRHFMNEPANTIIAQFPFILLPGLLVPVAYTMHIFSLRQLLLQYRSNRSRKPQPALSI